MRLLLPTFPAPGADRFIRHDDTTDEEQCVDNSTLQLLYSHFTEPLRHFYGSFRTAVTAPSIFHTVGGSRGVRDVAYHLLAPGKAAWLRYWYTTSDRRRPARPGARASVALRSVRGFVCRFSTRKEHAMQNPTILAEHRSNG